MNQQSNDKEISTIQVDANNPYLGLASFEEAHEKYFYGRSQEVQSLLRLVRRDVLTVLFGVSGLGKTSLLHAGLFPLLRQQNSLPIWIRLKFGPNLPEPEAQIKDIIEQAVKKYCLDTPSPETNETLWEYFHRVSFWSQRNRLLTPVLVFDQFEELFTLGQATKANRNFLQQLADLAENQMPASVSEWLNNNDEDLPYQYNQPAVKVIISLREDYLAHLEDLRKYMPSLARNRYRLLPMQGEQALKAVRNPKTAILVDATVAESIVRFVAGGDKKHIVNGDGAELQHIKVEPALLSLFCQELNQLRRNKDENTISAKLLEVSQDHILNAFYKRCVKGLSTGMQRFMEDELLTASGYRSTKALEDTLQVEGVSKNALQSLVDKRLLRQEERLGMPHLELIHDVMAPVVKQSREQHRHEEEKSKAEYEKRLREEEIIRLKHKALIVKFTVSAIFTVLISLGLLIFGFWHDAVKAEKKANLQLAKNYLSQGITKRDTNKDLFKASHYFYQAEKYASLIDNKILSDNTQFAGDNTARKLPRRILTLQHKTWGYDAVFTDGQQRFLTWRGDAAQTWDGSTGKPLSKPMIHKSEVNGAVFSGNQQRVLTWSFDGTARIWDSASGKPLSEPMVHKESVKGAVFSNDQQRVLTWSWDGTARVWNSTSGKPLTELMAHKSWVNGAVFSDDQQRVLTWSGDGTARIWDSASGKPLTEPMAHKSWVNGAVFSDDQQRVLTWSGGISSAGTARVWDSSSGKPLTESMVHKKSVTDAVFSKDQRRVLTWSKDGTARIWSSASGKPLTEPMVHNDEVNGAVFSDDQQRVLTWSEDGTVRIWDSSSGKPLTEPMVHKDDVNGAVFGDDQRHVLTWSKDGTARVWDSSSGKPLTEPMVHKKGVTGAVFSGDQQRVLTWSADRTARVWDSSSGKPLTEPMAHKKWIKGAAFSDDQQRVVVWSSNGEKRVWDSHSSKPLSEPMVHQGPVTGAVFSNDQLRVLTWGGNIVGVARAARVWDSTSGMPLSAPMPHKAQINGAVFSDNQQRVLTWSWDGTAQVWDSTSGKPLTEPMAHKKTINGAVFSDDQRRVLTWSEDGTARVWDSSSGKPLTEPMTHKGMVNGAVFSDDQQRILTWSNDGAAQVWGSSSGKPLTEPMTHKGSVNGAVFSDDQQRVLTWSGDFFSTDTGTARVWDSSNGKPLTEPMVHKRSVYGAVYSAEQQRVLTWSWDGTARVWDSSSGKPLTEPMTHKGRVNGAAFSDDQQHVLTWSSDGTARVWDSASGKPLTEPMMHKDEVNGAAFSDDQQRVLTWSDHGTALIWSSASGKPLTEPMVHNGEVNDAVFSDDQQRVLTWSDDGTARVWDITADLDYPKQHLSLRLKVKTWKQVNELGDVQELTVEDWQKKWNEYEPVAVEHLQRCSYPRANQYIDRMIHKLGSCEKQGEWLKNVNSKILPEVKKMYADFCLERGRQLLIGKYYGRAKRSIETTLALQPNSAEAYDRLAWTLISSGKNPKQGIAFAQKSLKLNPFQQPSYALNTLANGYAQTGKNALASETFLKLARAHVRWQQYPQAMDAYNQVLKLQAKEASQIELKEYEETLVKSLKQEKNYRKIAHYYKQAFQAGFTDSKTRAKWANSLAWTLIDNDIDIAKGMAYAEQSLQLNPEQKSHLAMDTLALAYIKQGKYKQAISLIKQALQQQPDNSGLKKRLQQAEEAKKAAHTK